MKKNLISSPGMCTISVDYVGWNPVRVDGFGDEITVHHTDTVFGLTSKPTSPHREHYLGDIDSFSSGYPWGSGRRRTQDCLLNCFPLTQMVGQDREVVRHSEGIIHGCRLHVCRGPNSAIDPDCAENSLWSQEY